MSKGTYTEFRDALRAFESGWDRDRYENGQIADWQLDQWAGGSVTDFYPGYSSWGDLSAEEWDAMSYRSSNSLGFVGYQFGEALLIDLGYYDDDQFYGNGASTNTWDGTWTGKNGVDSFEEFLTKDAQEIAIQEAFGYNLKIIENGLSNQGKSLDDFIGTTTTYVQDGQEVQVELTLTGIMAAAHLRGAYGTLNLLLNGSVSTDEYGTSILRYIDQFGGYDSPSIEDSIAFFEDRVTGDEGLGTPGDTGNGDTGNGDTGNGDNGDNTDNSGTPGGSVDGYDNAGITAQNADVVVTWSWGQNAVISDFDPANDTLFFDWISAEQIDITQTDQGLVFSIPSNNQTLTLSGITAADLNPENINALEASLRAELAALAGDDAGDGSDNGSGDGSDTGNGDGHGDGNGDGHGDGNGDGNGDGDGHGDGNGDGDGHGDGNGDGDGHGDGNGHTHLHVNIGLDTPAQTITNFNPAMGDMIEIGADVSAEDFNIFEESGDALGQTVRIEITNEGVTTQIIFTGFGLDDLSLANLTANDEGVQNEIASALGQVIVTPGEGGGYELSYDSDGSNPPATTGATDEGGVKYRADSNADDITGFDPATDQLDFGGTSVHGMIVTKSEAGEIVIDSPWSDAAQIVQGVTYQDVDISNFGVVGNEHFRQDMGGVVSWEQGVGPRDADTVYIRSHEYGQHEVIDGFDPASMKISFLYFGTRERLSVEDSDAGLVISSLPSGQSFTFTDVSKADLIPGMVEFHFDQVMEDNLETPFGFDQNDVTLVDRTDLLTPEAPAGATTDGFQTRTGDLTGSIYDDGSGDGSGDGSDTGSGDGSGDGSDTGSGDGSGNGSDTGSGSDVTLGAGADTVELSWNWGAQTTISGFDPAEDVFDFNALSDGGVQVSENGDDLLIEVLNNGGNITRIEGVQAEDLTLANLTADGWNGIDDAGSDLVSQLVALGMDLG